MHSMKNSQRGFTLIELVVVIVILGILAATALPKFVDMTADAERATTQGVAGAISSAGSVNYAKMKAGNVGAGGAGTGTGKAITDATDACAGTDSVYAARETFLTGSITLTTADSTNANEYKISGGTPKVCGAGVVVQCTITSDNGQSATAYVPCTN